MNADAMSRQNRFPKVTVWENMMQYDIDIPVLDNGHVFSHLPIVQVSVLVKLADGNLCEYKGIDEHS